eukprot:gnl/TRDRNA2_/TRDRNA2_173592_c2_seq3.p1 gnl/TRDRNA2_/TRDRNA2_173592_c2~~gnl/TRDRNA2_/TRDRNA2_173592_c2_seq3.p1  ORF type:complete len:565 (-),score=112.91 gnl/TRDRNA2_/TRDRNA2_173592_c2_seq3:99-1733(-)
MGVPDGDQCVHAWQERQLQKLIGQYIYGKYDKDRNGRLDGHEAADFASREFHVVLPKGFVEVVDSMSGISKKQTGYPQLIVEIEKSRFVQYDFDHNGCLQRNELQAYGMGEYHFVLLTPMVDAFFQSLADPGDALCVPMHQEHQLRNEIQQQVFDTFDVNGDGHLQSGELDMYARNLCRFQPSESELERMMVELGDDAGHGVSREHACSLDREIRSSILARYDTDGDAHLSTQEVIPYANTFHIALQMPDLASIWEALGLGPNKRCPVGKLWQLQNEIEKAIFRRYDYDQDGILNSTEVQSYAHGEMNLDLNMDAWDEIWRSMVGTMQAKGIPEDAHLQLQGELQKALVNKYDTNGNGVLDRDEVERFALMQYKIALPTASVNSMFDCMAGVHVGSGICPNHAIGMTMAMADAKMAAARNPQEFVAWSAFNRTATRNVRQRATEEVKSNVDALATLSPPVGVAAIMASPQEFGLEGSKAVTATAPTPPVAYVKGEASDSLTRESQPVLIAVSEDPLRKFQLDTTGIMTSFDSDASAVMNKWHAQ